jgi:hypothetical protein
LFVDCPDLEPASVVGLQAVRDLQQLFNRGIDAGEGSLLPEFHSTCLTASVAEPVVARGISWSEVTLANQHRVEASQ